ncbi:hypothetical protein [Streptomyces sp. bgisy100]|uniref:hypothetical protein n=1 Tax=Streptomyces sp. bgisy100 TaxID=3413783 RepID=UPI003D73D3A8
MMPERAGSASGDELAVPMAWLYAEYVADEVLRQAELMQPTTLEFRAGRDALALTAFLSGGAQLSGAGVVSQLEHWCDLTAAAEPWHSWCSRRLQYLHREEQAVGHTGADLPFARAAWRRLVETELLSADEDYDAGTWEGADVDEDPAPTVWTPAWQLGLPLASLALQMF